MQWSQMDILHKVRQKALIMKLRIISFQIILHHIKAPYFVMYVRQVISTKIR